MRIANQQQADHWNGEEASHWVTRQAAYDRMLAPITDMLLDAAAFRPASRSCCALRPPELDGLLASGPGRWPRVDVGGRMVTVGDWLVSRASAAASTVRGYTAHVRLYLAPYLG